LGSSALKESNESSPYLASRSASAKKSVKEFTDEKMLETTANILKNI
jgi:hypothetical protein